MKKVGFLLITICFTLILCSGCSKDGILNIYKSANEKAGDMVLTNKSKLKGNREFGEDHYTGTYEVTYKKFKELGKFGVSTTIQESIAKGMGITHAELLKQIEEIQNGNSILDRPLQDENDLIIKINNKLKTLSNEQLKMVYGLISETNSNKLEELDSLLKNMK